MNLEGDTLIQIQKWWYAILSDFCQYLSTKKSWQAYKYIKEEHINISYFILPPETNINFYTAK